MQGKSVCVLMSIPDSFYLCPPRISGDNKKISKPPLFTGCYWFAAFKLFCWNLRRVLHIQYCHPVLTNTCITSRDIAGLSPFLLLHRDTLPWSLKCTRTRKAVTKQMLYHKSIYGNYPDYYTMWLVFDLSVQCINWHYSYSVICGIEFPLLGFSIFPIL